MVFALAFAIGIVDGLRSLTAPAVVCWGAFLRWINLQDTWAAFFEYTATLAIFTLLAVGELIADKFPKIPSRKMPGPFAFRILLGGLSGAALTTAAHRSPIAGAILGGLGAVVGTLGGYAARTGLVRALKTPDFPIALLEDIVAVGGGFLIVANIG
jgi:uncharacterized membrane protein